MTPRWAWPWTGNRLAIGTAAQIWEFRDVPAVAARLEPPGSHDACFLPRSCHVTGNVQVHEMAIGATASFGSLTPASPASARSTATTASCLAGGRRSFRRWPRKTAATSTAWAWSPAGLATPRRWAATDEAAGWRADKARGGVLIDVPTDAVIASGLSMPHSPRWHQGKLWVCESGTGTLGTVDPSSGHYEPIVELPGFTRGLDFVGDLAFVGLSQIRETAVFSGLPITERLTERTCGVWVVEITSGRILAFLKFEDALQEIFAVQVLPGRRYPDLIVADQERLSHSFVLPEEALRDVPAAIRAPAPTPTEPGAPGPP